MKESRQRRQIKRDERTSEDGSASLRFLDFFRGRNAVSNSREKETNHGLFGL